MAWIRTRSRSFSFRPTKPRRPFATRRRTPISPPDRSTARSPPMRSRHRRATAVRRPFSQSIRLRRSRRIIRCTRPPKFPPAPLAARPADEVKTISFSHHIVARKGLSESTVAAFTRQLFAIRQTVMAEFPLAAKIETPDTDKDAVIPVHPGAAAFVDGEEKTFLDRYSDYIWWGLMALSAMGSAGAWFAGYLKKDERGNNSSMRERLLEMIAAARRCDSTEELDRMQAEADNILHDTLQCFEHGTIEEGALTAFNIALEQFHHAVADRRALLISLSHNLQRAGAQFRATGTL